MAYRAMAFFPRHFLALALCLGGCNDGASIPEGACTDPLRLALVASGAAGGTPAEHRVDVRFDGMSGACTLAIPQLTLQAGEGHEGTCSASWLRFEAVRPGAGGQCAGDASAQAQCTEFADGAAVEYVLYVSKRPAQLTVSVHRGDELVVAAQPLEPSYAAINDGCDEARLTLNVP